MIEEVSQNKLDEVLPLIRKYQEFYKVADISDSKNKTFFPNLANTTQQVVNFYSARMQ